jgi:hypothetical protein
VAATVAIVGVIAALVLMGPVRRLLAEHPTAEECTTLLDRYVEHTMHAADPSASSTDLASRKAQARALAASDPKFARCTSAITRKEADCALHANNADEFERCLP